MKARAVAKYIKGSPQKARLVIDLIRGRKANEALAILAGAGALVGILVSASYCWLAGISGRVPDSPRGQRS